MSLPADFWVPGAPRRPAFVCRLCSAHFYEGEERVYERHVVSCSNDREQEIHERSTRTTLSGLYGDGVNRPHAIGDPDYARYVRRTGKTE